MQRLFMLASFLYISLAAALDYNEVVLASDHNKVLVMSSNALSFRERSSLASKRGDPRTFMTLENGSLKIGDMFVCKSTETGMAIPCRTSTAVGGKFNVMAEGGHMILMQDNHNVLGPAPYNLMTDSHPVFIMNRENFSNNAYYLDIISYVNDELYVINPLQREFK